METALLESGSDRRPWELLAAQGLLIPESPRKVAERGQLRAFCLRCNRSIQGRCQGLGLLR